ncbi:hypothetical protein [Bacillus sp. T3]|uniref:hypothetical protein n=1 Tax=Bacillus sp. T3 TaxID=467262 RepID=UPI0029823B64|nr:hypothetical protein [Bacillus sp. T3]
MSRIYHLDAGYITIPAASKIVHHFLGIVQEDKSHYIKILRGAKKGWFGGKMHGRRMFQVRREEIINYAKELQRAEQYNLFTFDSRQKDGPPPLS